LNDRATVSGVNLNSVSLNSVSHKVLQRTRPNDARQQYRGAFFLLADQTETAAFGYLARALVLEQRVRRPLAIRDMRRSLTAGDGLASTIPR
jgi:hypothetical protein